MEAMDWTYKIIRWGLGAIFIYAGGTELLEVKIFVVLIEAYGIVSERFITPVASACRSTKKL
jgi:uncharacterized membrane protein YphA (DoxX/SURF4 family)